jgi:hypothetical protein
MVPMLTSARTKGRGAILKLGQFSVTNSYFLVCVSDFQFRFHYASNFFILRLHLNPCYISIAHFIGRNHSPFLYLRVHTAN